MIDPRVFVVIMIFCLLALAAWDHRDRAKHDTPPEQPGRSPTDRSRRSMRGLWRPPW